MHLGIDAFWGALPHGQLDLQQVRPEYCTWDVAVDAEGLPWLSVTPGLLLEKAMHARHLAIRVFLDEGINVISDDLIWTCEWLVDFLSIFESYDVWLVGLHVSDEEGARCERDECHQYRQRAAHDASSGRLEADVLGRCSDTSVVTSAPLATGVN